METTTIKRPSRSASSPRPDAALLDLLRQFVQLYWLRPENAYWMTLRSLALRECTLEPPTIDVACGDGLFSFVHAGGRLTHEFDVFGSVAQQPPGEPRPADMFDHIDAAYAPPVQRTATHSYACGCDQKAALLAKAAALRFYRELAQHDCNRALPFEDHAFATVYCNSAYWIANIDGFLRELVRIVRPGGQVILHVKLAAMRAYTLDRYAAQLGADVLRILDRGRRESWPTVATRAEWEQRFSAAGMRVASATPFVTRTHAHIWDVGLRPIAPLLVRMANGLTHASRAAIKRDWTDLMLELLTPLCRMDFDLGASPAEPAEMQYVLTPG